MRSFGPVTVGRFPRAGNPGGGEQAIAPAWVSGLTLNEWTALSTVNAAADVAASDVGQYGNTGPRSVFVAWSGAAHVSGFGDHGSILHWGGGHNDYYGNEVYAFDLDTLTWTRLTDPSTVEDWSAVHSNGVLPDGNPRVPHTYYYLTSDGAKLIVGMREEDNVGGHYVHQVSLFDPSLESWQNFTEENPLSMKIYDGFVYDSSRDCLWAVAQQPVSWAKGDLSDGSWTGYTGKTGNYGNRAGSVYVPTKDVVVSFPSGAVFGFSPADPTADKVDLTTSGTGPTFAEGDMAHWSGNLGAIVYHVTASDTLYTLTPPAGDWDTGTWTWSELSLTGSTGVHDGSKTLGKFQAVEYGDVTVALVNGDWDGAYKAVKLAA